MDDTKHCLIANLMYCIREPNGLIILQFGCMFIAICTTMPSDHNDIDIGHDSDGDCITSPKSRIIISCLEIVRDSFRRFMNTNEYRNWKNLTHPDL